MTEIKPMGHGWDRTIRDRATLAQHPDHLAIKPNGSTTEGPLWRALQDAVPAGELGPVFRGYRLFPRRYLAGVLDALGRHADGVTIRETSRQ